MKFEKVSREAFYKDCLKYFGTYKPEWYDNIKIPVRGTKYSAAYDFFIPMPTKFGGDGVVRLLNYIPTGIKVKLDPDKVLNVVPRSSMGIKHGIMLANTIGVIDADYYNNPDNEGDIILAFTRFLPGILTVKPGTKIAQGMIINYYTTEDDDVTAERTGGIGSTDKKPKDTGMDNMFLDATKEDFE